MPITVRTGSALKSLVGGRQEAVAEGSTVGELLENLDIRERICDNSNRIRRHFNIHVNEGEDVRFLEGLATPVKEGDTVMILSAIAGGSERMTNEQTGTIGS